MFQQPIATRPVGAPVHTTHTNAQREMNMLSSLLCARTLGKQASRVGLMSSFAVIIHR